MVNSIAPGVATQAARGTVDDIRPAAHRARGNLIARSVCGLPTVRHIQYVYKLRASREAWFSQRFIHSRFAYTN